MKNIIYVISFGVIAYLLFVGFKSLKSFANAPARDTKANSNEVIGCFSEENFKLVYKYLLWKKSVAKKLSPNHRVIVTANLLTVIDVETSEDERGKYIQFFKNNEYYFKVDAQKGVIPIFIKQKTSYVEDCQKIFCDLLERANFAKPNLEKFKMDNKPYAAVPPGSTENLKSEADYIVIGTVISVCKSEVKTELGSDFHYNALIQIESIESEFPLMPPILPDGTIPTPSSSGPKVGSQIKVQYWKVGQRPYGWTGPQGQNSNLEIKTKVRMFIKKDSKGSFHLLQPNGWQLVADNLKNPTNVKINEPQVQKAMSLNVEFTDQVSNFATRSGYVIVLFAHQAAGYEISMERDDFAKQIGNLAAAWKSGKPITVVLERGVQIKSINLKNPNNVKINQPQEQKAMSLNVEFTDRVTDFGTDSGYVSVLFSHQAAGYEISMERDDFTKQIGNLADAWKSGKPVKVAVGAVEIQSINKP